MRLIAKIIIIITSVALVALVLCYSVTQSLVTPKKLSSSLSNAGAYSMGADGLRSSFKQSLAAANVSGPEVDAILVAAVSTSAVEKAATPAIQNATEWLKNADARRLTVYLDLTSIKSQIVREAKLRRNIETGFVATREIPDQQNLLGGSGASKNIDGVRVAYRKVADLVWPLALGVAVGIGLLLLLSLRLPHKRLAWPGWVLLAAAAGGIALCYVLPVGLGATLLQPGKGSGLDVNGVALALIRSSMHDTLLSWYFLATIGAVLMAASTVEARKYHKKQKGHK